MISMETDASPGMGDGIRRQPGGNLNPGCPQPTPTRLSSLRPYPTIGMPVLHSRRQSYMFSGGRASLGLVRGPATLPRARAKR